MRKLGLAIIAAGAISIGATSAMAEDEGQAILNHELQQCEFQGGSIKTRQVCFDRAMQEYLLHQSKYNEAKSATMEAEKTTPMPENRKALNAALQKCDFQGGSIKTRNDCYDMAKEAYMK